MITQGKIANEIEQLRAANRAKGIYEFGASSLAGILNMSPFETPLSVYLNLHDGIQSPTGLPAEIGNVMEPFILQKWSEFTGLPLLGKRQVRHPDLPWAVVHLDNESEDSTWGRFPIEAKHTGFQNQHLWTNEQDGIAKHYIPQTQFQMFITGAKKCDVPVIISNNKFEVYEVKPDTELQSMIVEAASKFHRDHLVPGIPPKPSTPEESIFFTNYQFPKESAPLVEAPHGIYSLIKSWKDCEARAENLKAELIKEIGQHEGFLGEGWKVTYRQQGGKPSIDWDAICQHTGLSEHAAKQQFYKYGKPFRKIDFREKKR